MEITPSLIVALDSVYASLRTRHPGLPAALVTVEEPHPAITRRAACWRPGRFVTATGTYEGRIAFGYPSPHRPVPRLLALNDPGMLLGVLVHEAAHALATARGIKDTSRSGTYHNTRYRDLAAELGLEVGKRESEGWVLTKCSPALLDAYGEHLAALGAAMPAELG